MSEQSRLDNELSEVLSFFSLGRMVQHRRAGGFANENYFVSTESGEYVVKLLREKSGLDAKSEIPYLTRLSEHRFPAVPYLSANDQCVFQLEDLAAVVMEKIEGEAPEPNSSNCAIMARVLADLHSIPDSGLEPRPSFLSGEFIDQSIVKLGPLVSAEDLRPYWEAQENLASFRLSLAKKKPAIIHCDFTPNNCLFQGDQLVGVIDWEEVTLGYPLLDVANLVLSSCYVDSKLNADLVNTIGITYAESRNLEASDLELLSAAVRLAGLSFSLWVYLRWGVGSDAPFIKSSRQLYWNYQLEDLRLKW